MCVSKDIRKIIKEAENRGWYLYRKSKHYIYKHKNGGLVTVSSTSCNQCAIKKIKKDFLNNE